MKTNLTEKELIELGFVKKPCIIHPSRVCKDDELFIGQIDENGSQRDLFVYDFPRGFRFNKHIVVNYRNEVLAYTNGFMSGGIEICNNLNESRFYFNESEEWTANVKSVLEHLKLMEN